ncbi:patatin-like phospholipase family protein [Roseomonas terrae]|uniref:Patatin-like phospholipase family protein n=1 Tax=Neoroseomonas terrae TaxID=424799 RepID=A0ABS5EMM7_9PROT|nr:patatin-like phospholipase family protein [Neoroseomonas terrae]MBR0652268.1 patatin-like phospholipase family protein [Neoroseomonas terrae]
MAEKKRIKLALQGGGSHGAFTWGVLDRLLADERIEVDAVVGTSAGAMNAAVLTDGLIAGGAAEARRRLDTFWEGIGGLSANTFIQPTPMDRMLSAGNMDFSPLWRFTEVLMRQFSPYELNPTNSNPLRDHLEASVDFARLRSAPGPALFVCATNVLTGRLRVFERAEMGVEAVLASACLPLLHHAVEVDGQHYWDGGYCGNPPIFPLIYMGGAPDILIVQLNPVNIPEVPRDIRAIVDRMNTLSFNSSLMREMRMIHFVTGLIDKGDLPKDRYMRCFIHTIDAEEELAAFNASSKLNGSIEFLKHLRALGAARAGAFLDAHFDEIGQKSSADVVGKFL